MTTDTPTFHRLLITGGTGFIGRHLVRHLIRAQIPLRLFVRSKLAALKLFPEITEIIEGSIENREQVVNALHDCDGVIHLAGLYRFGRAYADELHQSNVIGTENIIYATRQTSIRKLLYLSTAGVLKTDDGLIKENNFPKKSPWGTPYKKSKWRAETAILRAISEGLPACIASPTCPLGEEDIGPTPTGRVIVDFLNGNLPLYTHAGINIIDVNDLAHGLSLAFFRGTIGDRYLMAGRNIWLKELLNDLSEITSLPAPRYAIPSSLLLLTGVLSELASPFRSKASRLNLETAIQGRRNQFCDAHQTYQKLGWRPSFHLTETLRLATQWQLKYGNVKSSSRLNPEFASLLSIR